MTRAERRTLNDAPRVLLAARHLLDDFRAQAADFCEGVQVTARGVEDLEDLLHKAASLAPVDLHRGGGRHIEFKKNQPIFRFL